MWKERMKVGVSKAEIAIQIELQRRGRATHLITQKPFEFDFEKDGVYGTFIDLYFLHIDYAVFVDGDPHLKSRQQSRDELVDAALRRRGVTVDRFQYRVPLSKKRKMEICNGIETTLDRLEATQKRSL